MTVSLLQREDHEVVALAIIAEEAATVEPGTTDEKRLPEEDERRWTGTAGVV